MNTIPETSVPKTERFYPATEDEPMGESDLHTKTYIRLMQMIGDFFGGRNDVFVAGNLFWYYDEDNISQRKAPDVMVIKGVDPHPPEPRSTFRDWDERARPCFILEIASESTFRDDLGEKRTVYERLRVREYFIFDPTGRLLETPLMGFRLMPREENEQLITEYEELLPSLDGGLTSMELGLYFRPEDDRLKLVNLRTREVLPEPSELVEAVRHERQRANEEARLRQQEEKRRLHAERLRLDEERLRIDEERLRVAEQQRRLDAETELARTKEELDRLREEIAKLRRNGNEEDAS